MCSLRRLRHGKEARPAVTNEGKSVICGKFGHYLTASLMSARHDSLAYLSSDEGLTRTMREYFRVKADTLDFVLQEWHRINGE